MMRVLIYAILVAMLAAGWGMAWQRRTMFPLVQFNSPNTNTILTLVMAFYLFRMFHEASLPMDCPTEMWITAITVFGSFVLFTDIHLRTVLRYKQDVAYYAPSGRWEYALPMAIILFTIHVFLAFAALLHAQAADKQFTNITCVYNNRTQYQTVIYAEVYSHAIINAILCLLLCGDSRIDSGGERLGNTITTAALIAVVILMQKQPRDWYNWALIYMCTLTCAIVYIPLYKTRQFAATPHGDDLKQLIQDQTARVTMRAAMRNNVQGHVLDFYEAIQKINHENVATAQKTWYAIFHTYLRYNSVRYVQCVETFPIIITRVCPNKPTLEALQTALLNYMASYHLHSFSSFANNVTRFHSDLDV
jgi:hypothetical protein